MIIGAQLIAPEGFGELCKGVTYYFLVNDPSHNRARLIEFIIGKNPVPILITLTSTQFEEALETGVLLETGVVEKYPPWLKRIEGVAISHLEECRVSAKESYDEKVNRRFLAISDLVRDTQKILISKNPNAVINARANASIPRQNAARLRLWFYAYITFGRNKWALMPRTHCIGGWDRTGPNRTVKLGRPSPLGKKAGYPCDLEMQKKICSGYVRFTSPSHTWHRIRREILINEFGCRAIEKSGDYMFSHPEGLPFPSLAQIQYWIRKNFSLRKREVAQRGANKARARAGDKGSFSEKLINVNQLSEFDGYYISEKLSGLTEGSVVDSFCVVRAVCGVSGAIVGIGFSEGRENMESYRMCLFSMALNKVKFCELFGVEIAPEHWPCEGLSGSVVFDRGPGANYDVEPQINWLGELELTPVFSGQSKSTVESSHPRDKNDLEQPVVVQSKLNFVTMARREIRQVLEDNLGSDATGRMEEALILAGVKATPIGVWNYWSGRGRDSSIGMQFETAVRSFLAQHPATIKQDAVYFYGRKYRSPELEATGVFDRVSKDSVIQTSVYVLTMCVRHIWLDVNGVLYELDMVRTIRTLEGERDISLRKLQEIDGLRRAEVAKIMDQRAALQQVQRDAFKHETGEDWQAVKRIKGRPSKSAASKRDKSDFDRSRGK
ncbi:transposase [Pseudomonas sp. LS.1a]|uniref:transposase n=1 Tax=Pseudomonas sp. LS.1a TaxID=2920387 RepID=UPI001F13BBC0|nr:transposase [Pseudomonas sp. LS.1a]UMY61674.1 transposase [Pseudomonas sp. LS.1a]